MNIVDGLCYDDVLLIPRNSDVKSRSDVDLSVTIKKNSNSFVFKNPVIPANMQSIMNMQMARQICLAGGLGIMHRFCSLKEQFEILYVLGSDISVANNIGFSIGVKEDDKNTIEQFVKLGAQILCIDIAHGDSEACINMTKWISQNYPNVLLIAGNVSTADGAERLWIAGADVVKVGVGPGSLCSTRIETGNGVPQLTALMDVYNRKYRLLHLKKLHENVIGAPPEVLDSIKELNKEVYIIADGGLKNSGDIVKALCFSDMVMAGNLFAGCTETPGNMFNVDGRTFKEYAGSSTHKTNHVEGVVAMVHPKGRYKDVLIKLLEGLQSGMSYQGVHNLTDLKKDPQFVRITAAGLRESHPHDVKIL